MLLDKDNRFATQVATGNVGTNIVGSQIDLDVARDIGAGQPVFLRVAVTTAIAAGAGGTYQVKLSSGTDASLTGAVDHITSAAFDAAAGIPAGTVLINQAIPAEAVDAFKQFLGIREVVGVANTTAGNIDAFLTFDELAYKAYDQGVV